MPMTAEYIPERSITALTTCRVRDAKTHAQPEMQVQVQTQLPRITDPPQQKRSACIIAAFLGDDRADGPHAGRDSEVHP